MRVPQTWCSRSILPLCSASEDGNPVPNLSEYVEDDIGKDGEKPRRDVDYGTKDLTISLVSWCGMRR